jgi:hypothetical protein
VLEARRWALSGPPPPSLYGSWKQGLWPNTSRPQSGLARATPGKAALNIKSKQVSVAILSFITVHHLLVVN